MPRLGSCFSPTGPRPAAWLFLVLSVGAACGGSKRTPTEPTSPPPATGDGGSPVVKFELKGDELGSRDPIAMLSEVSVDASASTGTGSLTYAIDFGDGTTTTGATGRHTFQAVGTYTISVEARDPQGRRGVATQQLTVKTVTGGWYHAAYNSRAKTVEVRRLTIAGQEGLTVRGVYATSGQPDRSFSATLTRPRNVPILVGDVSLEGVIPSQLNDDSATWPLQLRGGSADGQRLDFRAAVGDPASPGPDAVLRAPTESGDAVMYAGVPAEFDGSGSRGSGLSYFIDFGDGAVSAAGRSVHTFGPGACKVELTVVDGLGRADRESVGLTAFGLHTSLSDYWVVDEDRADRLFLTFDAFDGQSYTGIAHKGYTIDPFARATGTISPNRDVRIALSTGVEYRGTRRWNVNNGRHALLMTLTQSGGPENGSTFTMRLDSPY